MSSSFDKLVSEVANAARWTPWSQLRDELILPSEGWAKQLKAKIEDWVRLHPFASDASDELMGEASINFINTLRNRPTASVYSSWHAFLDARLTLSLKQAIRHCWRAEERQRRVVEHLAYSGSAACVADKTVDASEELVTAELRRFIETTIATFPIAASETLYLHVIVGLTASEIAQRRKVSLPTVSQCLKKWIIPLRKVVQEWLDAD